MKNPPNDYRPGNYWGWFDNVTPDEVRWQIDEMVKAGIGGCVMHARGGLEIEYMGKQWMDCTEALVDQGKKHDFFTIIDDEQGWPSGFGAGKVNGRGKEYWMKMLFVHHGAEARAFAGDPDTLAFYELDGENVRRISSPEGVNDDVLICIRYGTDPYYVDNLNPKVVGAFIEEAYEPYAKQFQKDFGNGIAAVFSDEPQMSFRFFPWSYVLADEYRNDHDTDIFDALPALFFKVKDYQQLRYRYWKTVNRLFVKNYAQQINNWCNDHGLMLTGHTLAEDTFEYIITASAGTMEFYENMGIPGIDWLWRVPLTTLAPKQLASVGEQMGKYRTLSEMYGASGWSIGMDEMRWIGDAHFVLGVGYMLQHLGLYSLKGSRKREYPPALFYQQPYWARFKHFNDYTAAMSVLVTDTRPVIDTLIIHPLHSAWIMHNGWDNREELHEFDKTFDTLMNGLLHAGVDFHLGDEGMMARHGSVGNGRIKVGKCEYKTVVVPQCLTIEPETLELLEQCKASGVRVVTMGVMPSLLSAVPSSGLHDFLTSLENFPNTEAGVQSLAGTINKPISWRVLSGGPLLGATRDGEDGSFHIFFNNDHDVTSIFELDNTEGLVRYDLETGIFEAVPSPIVLRPMSTAVLFKPANPLANVAPVGIGLTNEPKGNTINLASEWSIDNHTPNSLTLDYCSYSLDGGEWQPVTNVLLLQKKLVEGGKNCNVAMRYSFASEFVPDEDLYLVVELPTQTKITVNGKKLSGEDCGWWVDKSFRKIAINGLISEGSNEIIIEREFWCSEHTYRIKNDPTVHEAESNRITVETELEGVFLIGNFRVIPAGEPRDGGEYGIFVSAPFKIAAPVERLSIDSLINSGYPFFAGNITLSQDVSLAGVEGRKVYLAFNHPDATFVDVTVNGTLAKTLMWEPYCVDITGYVHEGINTISLTLWNSNRNLMGPHHNTKGEKGGVGHASYYDLNNYTDEYCLLNFGVPGNIRVIIA